MPALAATSFIVAALQRLDSLVDMDQQIASWRRAMENRLGLKAVEMAKTKNLVVGIAN
jgi:hypothetical protein